MLGLGLSLQKGVSAFNAGRALVSSYIRRVTSDGGVLQNTACDVAAINELNQDRLLEPASWVLVPDGIKEDVVYAQKPSTGLGDLTFTRASDATYTDSTGVVRRSPYNLLTFSEMFSNAIWGKVNSSISIDATLAPNGTLTADKLIDNSVNDQHRADQTSTSQVGTNTFSIYAKKAELSFIQLRIGLSGAYFDLNNGTIGGISGVTASIQDAGNGWYRCTIVRVSTVTSEVIRVNLATAVNTNNFIGTGTSGVFIWGAQLVEGTSALDYFPTTNRQDVPRIDFRNADGTLSSCGRLLLEPQRTNSIRNSSMVGAVAGSPGTLPTNWGQLLLSGLTRTVIGTGIENGLPYVDVRYNGTASGTAIVLGFETTTGITAATAQTWTGSFYIKTIASAPNAFRSIIIEYTSTGGYVLEQSTAVTVSSTLNRVSQTYTLAGGATTARVLNGVSCSLTNGAAYDFTIRIAAPQMELGAYATTWVPTTTAAVTRLADFASKTGVSSLIGQSQGTLFVEVNDAVLGNVFSGTGRRFLTISDNTLNNRIILFKNSSNDSIQFVVVSGGVEQASISTSTNQSGVKKIAAGYANNDFVLYVNGVQIGADTSGAVPSCDRIALGYETTSNLSNPACPVAQAALFPTRLSNDQLEVLTSEGYGNYALLAQSLNCVLQ